MASSDSPRARRATAKGSSSTPDSQPNSRRAYLPADQRRRSIIEAAQAVFSHTNLQGARTRDLAKAAGVNQATIYSHFESKEALFLEAVVQPMVDAMRGMYERAATYEKAESAEEILATATRSVTHHLESMIDMYPLLTTALFSDPDLGRKLYREQIAPLFEERGRVMKNVVRDDIDPELFSLLAFGMFFAVAMNRHFSGEQEDLSEVAEQIARFSTLGFLKDRYRE